MVWASKSSLVAVLGGLLFDDTAANFASMAKLFDQLKPNYTSTYKGDGFRGAEDIPGAVGLVFLQNLWNYGCWCRFEDAHGLGSGAPVNPLDEVCKVLHHGYTCVMLDDAVCDPFAEEYTNIVNSADTLDGMVDMCGDRNPTKDLCVWQTCAIESWFVLEILRLYFLEHYTFDPSFMEVNGFDGSECSNQFSTTLPPFPDTNGGDPGQNGGSSNGGGAVSQDTGNGTGTGGSNENSGGNTGNSVPNGGSPSDPSGGTPSSPPSVHYSLQCCGTYPQRFPYNSLGGRRGCCGRTTYNTEIHACCDDNSIITGNTC